MDTVASSDGTHIAYESIGEGPALVYITGAICHRRFQPIVDDAKVFARRFTVYTYDRRGRGDSGSADPYKPALEIEDVRSVIDSAGGNAFVYGHSSGAVLALETALGYPDRVRGVFAYDAPYVENSEECAAYHRVREEVAALIQAEQYARAVRYFLRAIGTPRFATQLMRLVPGWKRVVQLAPTLLYDTRLAAKNEQGFTIVVKLNVDGGLKIGAPVDLFSRYILIRKPFDRVLEAPV